MPLRPDQRQVLDRGKRVPIRFRNKTLYGFEFGHGPTVLLIHGWGGRGAQMISWVDPLVSAGFRPVIVDMPAHGSSSGSTSTLVEFRDAVRHLADFFSCEFVIAHSFGAAAALLAIQQLDLPARRAVLVASPSGFDHYIDKFLTTLELPASFWPKVQKTIEASVGMSWSEFDLLRAAGQLSLPLLIFHDLQDAEVRMHHGEALGKALPNAELVRTSGLGHNRILRDRDVIDRAAAFLSSHALFSTQQRIEAPLPSATRHHVQEDEAEQDGGHALVH